MPSTSRPDAAGTAPVAILLAELMRRYGVMGIQGGLLELNHLAWLLSRATARLASGLSLGLRFEANRYGPQAIGLVKQLESVEGVYLCCEQPLRTAALLDDIWFNDVQRPALQTELQRVGEPWLVALDDTRQLIDGFESPFGLELLAGVDWLLARTSVATGVDCVRAALKAWPLPGAGERKARVFDERAIGMALDRLEAAHA